MNDRQLDLIMQIVLEQLDDYLSEALAMEISNRIEEGIRDNKELLEQRKQKGA